MDQVLGRQHYQVSRVVVVVGVVREGARRVRPNQDLRTEIYH